MNRKIFIIGILAFFLVMCAGAVSAQSINVQVAGDMPDQVKVSLLCDGKVVDTATLSSANSWSAKFNVDDDGSYSLTAKDTQDYSFSVSGSAESGFVVNSKSIADDSLKASDDSPVEESDLTDETQAAEDNDEYVEAVEVNDTDVDKNITDENSTDDNSTDDNSTDDNSTDDNSTGDNATDNSTDNSTSGGSGKGNGTVAQINGTPKVVKEEIKKPVKENPVKKNNTVKKQNPVKKQNKTAQAKMQRTGLPLVALVVIAFAAIFIPFNRRK